MSFLDRVMSRFSGSKKEVSKDPRQFMTQAEDLRRAGLYSEAILILEQGLAANPGYVTAHMALGRIYQQTHQLERAVEAYQTVLKLDRENLVAIRQLADTYLAQGEKVEAIKKLKLFRALKAGDREVQELIERLDAELNPGLSPPANLAPLPAPQPVPAQPAPAAEVAPAPPVPSPPLAASYGRDTAPVPPLEALAAGPAVETPRRPPDELRVLEEGPTMAMSILELLGPLQQWERERQPVPEGAEGGPEGVAPLLPEPEPELEADAPPPVEESSDAESPFSQAPSARQAMPVPVSAQSLFDDPFSLADELADAPASVEVPPPAVTETLAELYERQGYTEDARQAWATLAAEAVDAGRRRELEQRAERLGASPKAQDGAAGGAGATASGFPSGPSGRLRAFLANIPSRVRAGESASGARGPGEARLDDLAPVLEELVGVDPSILAASLTDLEGLPVVSAGRNADSPELEALVAELTTFWKSVERTRDEVGAGRLSSLALSAEAGSAFVSSVTGDYALILQLSREAALGRIRFETARAAERLRPALG